MSRIASVLLPLGLPEAFDYAEPDGMATRHTILPISMGGGFVRGQESGSPGLRSFPLHRITAVHLVAHDEDD